MTSVCRIRKAVVWGILVSRTTSSSVRGFPADPKQSSRSMVLAMMGTQYLSSVLEESAFFASGLLFMTKAEIRDSKSYTSDKQIENSSIMNFAEFMDPPFSIWFPHPIFAREQLALRPASKSRDRRDETMPVGKKAVPLQRVCGRRRPHGAPVGRIVPGFGEFWFALYRNTVLEIRHISS